MLLAGHLVMGTISSVKGESKRNPVSLKMLLVNVSSNEAGRCGPNIQ